jgi:hypothetical protein
MKTPKPKQWPVAIECNVRISLLKTADSQDEAIRYCQEHGPLLFLLGQQHACPKPDITVTAVRAGEPLHKKNKVKP